ncbi:MAG: NAD(P) transhydrogenase subunit alpha [Actinobacteria bacterium ADurb.Bin346]|nr:MAG: NAD(P) transhydrogenase subunit alpha [Actinobacteria bacterium ADurb.Bin346]
MKSLILIIVFIVSTFIGYKIIKKVPSLLHTPLMSGMNALSGITLLSALTVTALSISMQSKIFGVLAVILAMINVAAGFGITHRMLKMFKSGKDK